MRLHFFGTGAVAISLFMTTQAYAADDTNLEAPAAPAETPARTQPIMAPSAAAAPTASPAAPPVVAPSAPVAPAPVAPAAGATLSLTDSSSCGELPDGCPRVALAPARPAPESPRAPMEWYGHQTLIMDGVTLGVGVLGASSRSAEAAIASAIMYGAGVPLVHLGNGHPWMALASLATRASAPFVGGMTGVLIGFGTGPRDSSGGNAGAFAGLAIGTVTGVVAAVVLDAAVYSREHKAPPPAWDGKPTLSPTASVTPGGASIGLGGAF